jgi:hypothetical protein
VAVHPSDPVPPYGDVDRPPFHGNRVTPRG